MKNFVEELARPSRFAAAAAIALALGGCVSSSKPATLPPPAQITCFTVPTALSYTEEKGLFSHEWTTRLERGPYVSEHTDAGGTYYRAPPGGVSYGRADGTAETSSYAESFGPRDGGVYVPNDANKPPSLYTYFSTANAAVVVPPDNADCASVRYVLDPVTKGVSAVNFAVAGAAGGAAGALVTRALNSGMHLSFGQSAAAGAAGGLIGGLVVAAIINADTGNIRAEPVLKSKDVTAEIQRLARTAAPLDATQAEAPPEATAAQK
jgi:hypothetical protein